jgi:hypothetical protein
MSINIKKEDKVIVNNDFISYKNGNVAKKLLKDEYVYTVKRTVDSTFNHRARQFQNEVPGISITLYCPGLVFLVEIPGIGFDERFFMKK